ncbi:TadE family protein [Polaromonas sp.]|jgi:Flp pilus assembly protein TadG|uniref:TadE/TadG family type IV pilus assembly protein n=1 Tax=Polaromonas sp. TaxID=1869339 RepID=UPI001E0FC5C5|nr:TadE family protein [Polaromonas sp.]MBT9476796.1 pilus assembly protein [Polaromonas sp.]
MNKRQKGVALVEFALILPLLLLLSMITTEFGRAMYQYNTLTKSVRDASRYLSLQTPGTKITEARNLMVYGNTAGTGAPLALGLTTSHVPDPTWQTAGTNPVINTVTVQIEGYTFNSLFPSVFGISFGNIPFNPISATMRSYL